MSKYSDLEIIQKLREDGKITEEEFHSQKEKTLNKNDDKNEKKFLNNDNNILTIAIVIIGLIALVIGIIFMTDNTNFENNTNFVGITNQNKEKKINISEDEIKKKIETAKAMIQVRYPNTHIANVMEIRIIYNYKEKTIDNFYMSVKFTDKLYVAYQRKSQYTWASISKENVYNDIFITGIHANELFKIENLTDDECLVTEENNILLTELKEGR